jgi:hypothetical protein
MSFQTQLTNHTPFAAGKFVQMDLDGQEVTLIVLAATFQAAPRGLLAPAPNQPPPFVEDVYAGDPAASSLLVENEVALMKPKLDVVVVGTAYAPGGKPAAQVPVELKVGDIRKVLAVSGHRTWAMRAASRPVPFVSLPIRYEQAFGGMNPQTGACLLANPVGVGWKGIASKDDLKLSIPNVEYPDSMVRTPSDQIRPAGLSPIARWWEPRSAFTGTCDEKWKETRWPLLPKDFDPRFNQIAPPDQQSSTITGGEPVRLTNLTPDGAWDFRLPKLHVPVHLVYDAKYAQAALRLDTVFIEPDKRSVRMTARLSVPTVRGQALREIVLGHVTKSWMRVVHTRKRYVDLHGDGGADKSVPTYTA